MSSQPPRRFEGREVESQTLCQRLTMTGTAPPDGDSGAQWLFAEETTDPLIFCAYNNGDDGP